MIRVTIELLPFEEEKEIRRLSQLVIHNTGKTKSPDTYTVKRLGSTTPVKSFEHDKHDGPIMLVGRAISALLDKPL